MIKDQIRKDVELFRRFKLMDYSLLFAVERNPLFVSQGTSVQDKKLRGSEAIGQFLKSHRDQMSISMETSRHQFVSSCGKYIYHMAIIDYLQAFDLEKKSESLFKTLILRRPKALISAVDPELYASRFVHFMSTELLQDSLLGQERLELLLEE